MFGIGKPRSKLGKYIDKVKVTQGELSKHSKVNRNTISELCSTKPKNPPKEKTMTSIVSALRKLGHDVSIKDFWNF